MYIFTYLRKKNKNNYYTLIKQRHGLSCCSGEDVRPPVVHHRAAFCPIMSLIDHHVAEPPRSLVIGSTTESLPLLAAFPSVGWGGSLLRLPTSQSKEPNDPRDESGRFGLGRVTGWVSRGYWCLIFLQLHTHSPRFCFEMDIYPPPIQTRAESERGQVTQRIRTNAQIYITANRDECCPADCFLIPPPPPPLPHRRCFHFICLSSSSINYAFMSCWCFAFFSLTKLPHCVVSPQRGPVKVLPRPPSERSMREFTETKGIVIEWGKLANKRERDGFESYVEVFEKWAKIKIVVHMHHCCLSAKEN